MSLLDHAREELFLARDHDDAAISLAMVDGLLSVVDAFAKQGHSGGSAAVVGPRVAYIIGQLLAFEPITPLTGGDDEWTTVAEKMIGRPGVEQNRRCSRVFREGSIAYDVEAVVFRDWRGPGAFTSWDSARRVTFPYTPTTRHTRFRRLSRLRARLRRELRP